MHLVPMLPTLMLLVLLVLLVLVLVPVLLALLILRWLVLACGWCRGTTWAASCTSSATSSEVTLYEGCGRAGTRSELWACIRQLPAACMSP